MTATPPTAPAGRRAFGWSRRMLDRVPTPWLITGGTGAALALTAAFGGLNGVSEPQIPELTVGESFSGSDLLMTVIGVELSDERAGSGVYPDAEKGERVLTVILDVTNEFTAPRTAASGGADSPVVDGITIEGVTTTPPGLARADDGTYGIHLQPDVPVRIVASWVVGAEDVQDGDEVRITLPDSTHGVGQAITMGDYWSDPVIGAYVTAEVDEVEVP
ncbi:hypothetical protein [Microbacterium sp. H1-D42]|uniref:hypothetical protein n=1 Tax=Microbacterium sp. H1-D42 TaxID=2925844 RepID=UPI001F53DDFD|nr:hypothetical protein [Microbacterium sp. H1-D42]UNK71326.1 hypothetical protein MNR00_02395 [Microbacterium sp. H1-D42]